MEHTFHIVYCKFIVILLFTYQGNGKQFSLKQNNKYFSGRAFFLGNSNRNILKIISFVQYKKSLIRRGAAASMLRNCCFDYGIRMLFVVIDICNFKFV